MREYLVRGLRRIERAMGEMTPDGDIIVAQGGGKYEEAVARGIGYAAVTDSAGVAPGTAIGTAAAFALDNPIGSDTKLVVMKSAVDYMSGTLGAGKFHHCLSNDGAAAAVTGTEIPFLRTLGGGGGNQEGVGKAFDAATLPATPTILPSIGSLGAILASTAVAFGRLARIVDDEPDHDQVGVEREHFLAQHADVVHQPVSAYAEVQALVAHLLRVRVQALLEKRVVYGLDLDARPHGERVADHRDTKGIRRLFERMLSIPHPVRVG